MGDAVFLFFCSRTRRYHTGLALLDACAGKRKVEDPYEFQRERLEFLMTSITPIQYASGKGKVEGVDYMYAKLSEFRSTPCSVGTVAYRPGCKSAIFCVFCETTRNLLLAAGFKFILVDCLGD